jgi:hypothetical protein
MAGMSLNVNEWSQEQFGQCALGDRRRTARLVRYAAQVAADPSPHFSPPLLKKGGLLWHKLFCRKQLSPIARRPPYDDRV